MPPPDDLTRLTAALAPRYAIERELGRGGMATVYLAHDTKHNRQVAVKVLRPELAAILGAERFLREVAIAASLNHPHVVPLYDSGWAAEFLYYVMPHIAGESLRQRLAHERQLSLEEALRITRHVASALEYAHTRGIVHRDIKPENILIHEGEALLADFGIALAVDAAAPRMTETGLAVGTPEYMSPEQATGERALDARTDVYSLACVLYEMLAGEPPYTGPTAQALIAKRLVDPVPSVRRLRAAVPAGVEQVLMRALARVPADRFAAVREFVEALEAPAQMASKTPTVAVLPFLNLSADPENEYFADGITEDVIAQLSKMRALRVISRTSVMRFKGREQSLREIGAALEATTILEGSVRRAGDRVRIVAQLIDVDTDQHLWADTYDRRLTDIFVIQSDVALHIASALRAELSKGERNRIGKEPTGDLEAYELYLQGRQWYTRYSAEGFLKSVEYFDGAVARDPQYAMAYVGLAAAHTEIGETGADLPDRAYRRAKEAALRALALDRDLGEAHCALAYVTFVSEFDWVSAEREFKRALELTPGSAQVYELYGRLCSAQQRFDEAIAMYQRALELDPIVLGAELGTAYLRAGSFDEALRQANRVVESSPTYARGHATLAWALVKKGLYDQGIEHLRTAISLAPDEIIWQAQLGQVYGIMGDEASARGVLRQIQDLARERYVSPYYFAYVHTGLGEYDRAMDYLEQAFADRAGAVYGIKGSFLFTALHSHPRFTALLRKMNLA
jgi:serine/threonine-protein kinase